MTWMTWGTLMTWETSIYGKLNREDYKEKAKQFFGGSYSRPRFPGLGDFFDIHDKIPILFGIGSPYVLYTLRAHHQECIFHMQMRPQKRALVAALFEHKPTDSQMHSPLPNCEESKCNGLCLGRHVARKQARGVEPHVDKLQGDHPTRNYCSSNPHVYTVNKGPRRFHLWLRPSYVRLRPSNPRVNKRDYDGLRPF